MRESLKRRVLKLEAAAKARERGVNPIAAAIPKRPHRWPGTPDEIAAWEREAREQQAALLARFSRRG